MFQSPSSIGSPFLSWVRRSYNLSIVPIFWLTGRISSARDAMLISMASNSEFGYGVLLIGGINSQCPFMTSFLRSPGSIDLFRTAASTSSNVLYDLYFSYLGPDLPRLVWV